MRYLKGIIIMLFIFQSWSLWAQPAQAIQQYIEQYKELAIAEMKRTGVPASIKLAQGIHETMAGQSELVQKSNNHFGIKCKTGWSGPSVRHTDDARNECFRKYETATASYQDHSNFLKSSGRYASLFELDPTDYEAWAKGLKSAGYATNPVYAQTLVRLIEDYDLQQYTMMALGYENGEEDTTETTQQGSVLAPVNNKDSFAALPPKQETVPAKPVVMPTKENVPAFVKKEVDPVQNEQSSTSYPAGVFKEKGIKALYVSAGTPYLVIAEQYHIPLARLFEWNNLAPATLAHRSQVIYLEKPESFKLRWPSLRSRQ